MIRDEMQPHVFWGAVIGVFLIIALVTGVLGAWVLLPVSLILAGIAVDVTAHGYTH